MTKQLYEEALADVRKVKEVAEASAQRAVLDAVTPRIRDLIERELLREAGDYDDDLGAPGSLPPEGELMTDLVVAPSVDSSTPAAALTPPDEEGKVTLDLDALCDDPAGTPVDPPVMGSSLPGEEYEINLESIEALTPVLKATKLGAAKELELMVFRIGETVTKFSNAGRLIRESKEFHKKIAQMISQVEDMYDYVQESVVDPAKKSSYETKLESYFSELNKLQEPTMSQKNKKMMNEEDVTLKLTGLPDDVDLDSVGVDLITGEEDDEGDGLDMADDGEDSEDSGADDAADGDDDMDLGDLDLGDDEGAEMGESRRLSDDTIVEIDEGMLRREIFRMRKLREEAAPSSDGFGVDASAMDDFGGGSDEGDPLAGKSLGESDDADELEELAEVDDEETVAERYESLKRRSSFEARLQERAKARAASLKKEAVRARARKDVRKEATLKREYAQVAKRFNESVGRYKKISKLMVETKRLYSGSRQNGNSTRSAETKAVSTLRNKLAETNLINAKLLFTNKLLQNESLSSRQKAQVIEQLDSAKTVREAKLVYESLAKTLGGTSKPVNENNDRRVIGSSSRVTRSSNTQSLNEGYEAERWARLAGIVK